MVDPKAQGSNDPLDQVQDGWQVVEVARRLGVSRQSVHTWIARYETGGLAALADRSPG